MIKKELKKYYELFISLLALIVAVISVCEVNLNLSVNTLKIFNIVNSVVWIIFTVDYFTRLILSKEKLEFIKTHKIDFISILPFTPFLRSLRIINIFRVKDVARIIRFTSYIYKFKERISNILFIGMISILPSSNSISYSTSFIISLKLLSLSSILKIIITANKSFLP